MPKPAASRPTRSKTASKPARPRRQRGSINADDIVAGAFEVARRGSLDQLSMPTLAEHLSVGVTSIYWYFRKKDELLDRMTDVAVDAYLKELPAVSAEDTWQESLYDHFHMQREIHRKDEILSDLLLIRTSAYSRESTRLMFETVEALVRKLADAGFPPEDALKAYNAASVYTRGMIIYDRLLGLSDGLAANPPRGRVDDWATMPLLGSLLDGMADDDFEFGLRRLISGSESLLRERLKEAKAAARKPATSRLGEAKRTAKSTAKPRTATRSRGAGGARRATG